MRMKALGLIEVVGFTAGVEALDAMLKTANVELVSTENSLGGRLVTIMIQGDIVDVKEAVENGKAAVGQVGNIASSVCINNPHDEVKKLVKQSSEKLKVGE